MTANNDYPGLYQQYQWLVPARFHMAEACCGRWASQSVSARRIALYLDEPSGRREVWTFERLQHDANRLSHALLRMGIQPGDRIAVMLPPQGEFLVSLLAGWQVGAIMVPLSVQLNATLIERCLRDSGSRVAITQASTYQQLLPGLHRCTSLQQIIGVGLHNDRAVPWLGLLARQPDTPPPAPPPHATDALLFYDTLPGTPPRGLLHRHAALIGALPGFVAAHNWFPQRVVSYWVGLDWAVPAALLGGLLPCLYFGQALVAQRQLLPIQPEPDFLARHGVSHMLASPMVLHQLRHHLQQHPVALPHLHTVVSTGQFLGPALQHWYQTHRQLRINNAYSATGLPLLAGHSPHRWPDPPESLGRVYPGHQLQLHTLQGQPAPTQTCAQIVMLAHDLHHEPDPLYSRGHWPPGASSPAPAWPTGDLAWADAEGRFWWAGRENSLIATPSGPINPECLEAALLEHPAVAEVGVVALTEHPDPLKLKAWVVLHAKTPLPANLEPALLALGARHWPEAASQANWQIELTDHLPRQPSGRLLRTALRARDRSRRRRARKAA